MSNSWSNSCHIEIDWGFSFNVHFNIIQPTRGFYSNPLYMSWQTPWFSADSPINPICRSRKWQRSEQTEEIPVESADAIFDVSHDQKVMVPNQWLHGETRDIEHYWIWLNGVLWYADMFYYLILIEKNMFFLPAILLIHPSSSMWVITNKPGLKRYIYIAEVLIHLLQ